MAPFEVIPAIDIRGGSCVRLYQGDFARETVFSSSPIEVAGQWEQLGACRLHVVDLDGSRAGVPGQLRLVSEIAAAVDIPVQLGGGLRRLEDVEAALQAGVQRVVLGTAAIGDARNEQARTFRLACLRQHPGRVVIGLDARDDQLAVRGWSENTTLDAFVFARQLRDEGFDRIVYTDISRDGALSGPNLEHVERLSAIERLAVLASGGVARLEDLAALRAAGAEGAIVGQALYTNAIRLPEAIAYLGAAGVRR